MLIALFNLFHIPDFLSTAALRNALFMCHILFYEREREGSECNSILCSKDYSMVGIEGGEEDSPCIPVVHIY